MRTTRLMRLDELADATGLPRAWLKAESDAGRIPCFRAGRSRMFDLPRVLATLDERADQARRARDLDDSERQRSSSRAPAKPRESRSPEESSGSLDEAPRSTRTSEGTRGAQ